LLAKHLGDCARAPLPCPHECGAICLRADLASHLLVCEKNCEDCTICGDRVLAGTLSTHRRDKAEFHADLLEAKLAEYDQRSSQHESVSSSVSRIEEQMRGLARTQHVSAVVKARAEEIKSTVRKFLMKRAEWQIKGIEQLKRKNPKGTSLQSPEFEIGGISGLRLLLYPNGEASSKHGKSSLSLFGSGDVVASYELNMCGETCTVDGHDDWDHSMGHDNLFPIPTTANTSDDTLKIEVHLLRVALRI